jgi:delta(3,5)-delta(2,4)-dienoyl-CoA isomerase
MTTTSYGNVNVTLHPGYVAEVELNRPEQKNALDIEMWDDIRDAFTAIKKDERVRCVVLTGAGKHFTAGIDLTNPFPKATTREVGRRAVEILRMGTDWQDCFNTIEGCGKPVIACVHGACIGAGLEMISACDIRYCTENVSFVLKEADVGLASDVGGLQRLPKLVGNDSLMRELAFSARPLKAEEALRFGLVSKVCKDRDEMVQAAVEMAGTIAAKSPIVSLGIKVRREARQGQLSRALPTATAAHFCSSPTRWLAERTVRRKHRMLHRAPSSNTNRAPCPSPLVRCLRRVCVVVSCRAIHSIFRAC